MKKYFGQLILCCIAWMYASLVLFSSVCLIYFKETLVVNQILSYSGLAMICGAVAGAVWSYLNFLRKTH